jgi:DNA polymerase-3 subunit chi
MSATPAGSEVRFYHLTERPLEAVLPTMLERCLARGWRAVVRAPDPGLVEWLDAHLWTYRDESFLPHARAGDGAEGARQPIWLTTGGDMPNAPDTLFLLAGAEADPAELARLAVSVVLFDGHDPAAVERARGQWRAVAGAGLAAVYWAQTPAGGWEARARSDRDR